MSRLPNVDLMPADERNRLDFTIRSHNYYRLDVMVEALRKQGIRMHRSSLSRYVQRLAIQDGLKGQDEKLNIVFMVNRSTGQTETAYTTASLAQIQAAISSHQHPRPFVS